MSDLDSNPNHRHMSRCLPLVPGLLGVFALGHDLVHDTLYPLEVLGHLRVDAVLVFASAALAPAYHTRHKPCVFVFGDMWATAVTLTRILFLPAISGTEHAGADGELGGLLADGAVYEGHSEPLQNSGLQTTLLETTKSSHHSVFLLHEHTLCKVAVREACWEDVLVEGNGLHKLDKGNVIVVGLRLIVCMNQNLFDGMYLFWSFLNQCVGFTCHKNSLFVRIKISQHSDDFTLKPEAFVK